MVVLRSVFVLVFAIVVVAKESGTVQETPSSSNKLSKLKEILTAIEKEESLPKGDDSAPTEKARESSMEETSDKRESVPNKPKVTLTEDEIAALKALKTKLEKEKNDREQELVNLINSDKDSGKAKADLGKFYENSLSDDDIKEQKIQRLKLLASAILKSNEDNSQQHDSVTKEVKRTKPETVVEPKEGKFGDFRKEGTQTSSGKVLYALEEKLLKDVDLTLRSGFTLEEIISDLQKQENKVTEEEDKNFIKNKLKELLRGRKK